MAWGPAAVWAAVLFFLSALPEVPPAVGFQVNDKVLHLSFYGVLGSALAWGAHRSLARVSHRIPIAAGILYGVTDEIHQMFVPGRTPSIADLAADAVGVVVGYAAFHRLLTGRWLWRARPDPS